MSKKNILIIALVCLFIVLVVGFIFLRNNDKTIVMNDGGIGISTDYDKLYQDDSYSDGEIPNVSIQFGNGGKKYIAEMENNSTARKLVRNITNSGRNLPIYNYDNFEGYEYFQYYDVPTSYKIPSNPIEVTSEKAGEIYYSSPNRVIIFYQDANIKGNFTKIGEIKDTSGFKEAVENNPVLEGWGNKLVLIRYK